MSKSSNPVGRREFMKSSAAFTGGLLLVSPETAFGSSANSRLDVALLGCGGRGNAVAEDFVKNTNVQVAALGDLFQDQLDATEQRFNGLQKELGRSKVDKRFVGPDAFQQVAATKGDVVIIATPPYFHPQHLQAMLDAGRHIYLEKPVSTHVRGCMEVASLAEKAAGKVSVDVGFQIRYGSQFVQQTQRLHEGAIGDIALVHGFYFAGDLPRRGDASMRPAERKIRNWVFDRVLGGDIIVEQNIHILDSFNWILGAHPLRVQASAARKVRTDIGDVSDQYTVTLFYPNDVHASFASTQFLPQWGSVGWRCFGPQGFSEAFYSGGLVIRGQNPWEAAAGDTSGEKRPEVDPLGDATPLKVKAFVESIHSGNFHNQLKQGAESTLTAILCRQSAYEDKEMTWGELLASDQHWETDVDITKL
jgi:myo-inositol 2-dehydrogenase/D-chiro-inositol 1-dehydrogenase